tara:strand:+ start:489 stop:941 length:453 start_codon:yes stop_codon:yes gene_type:complete
MRLRYSLTSDIKDVPKHVKQQLELYANKTSLDSKMFKIIGELTEEKINFVGLEQEILWLRQELAALSHLLGESADILKACAKAEKGEIENQLPPTKTAPEEPQNFKQEPSQKIEKSEEHLVDLQNSVAQLSNMAKTFKEMKDSNKEKRGL